MLSRYRGTSWASTSATVTGAGGRAQAGGSCFPHPASAARQAARKAIRLLITVLPLSRSPGSGSQAASALQRLEVLISFENPLEHDVEDLPGLGGGASPSPVEVVRK